MVVQLVGGNKHDIKIEPNSYEQLFMESTRILKNKQNLQSLFIRNWCDGTRPTKLSSRLAKEYNLSFKRPDVM